MLKPNKSVRKLIEEERQMKTLLTKLTEQEKRVVEKKMGKTAAMTHSSEEE